MQHHDAEHEVALRDYLVSRFPAINSQTALAAARHVLSDNVWLEPFHGSHSGGKYLLVISEPRASSPQDLFQFLPIEDAIDFIVIEPPQGGFSCVIRRSDLQLFATLFGVGGIGTAIGAHQTSQSTVGPGVGLALGMLAALLRLHRNVATKGAKVDCLKMLILGALRKVNDGKGAAAADIAGFLAPAIEKLTEADVLSELKELSKYTSMSGEEVRLVHQDPTSGMWHSDCWHWGR